MKRQYRIILALVIVVLGAATVLTLLVSKGVMKHPFGAPARTTLVDQTTLDGLAKKSGSSAITDRIGSDIIPPTNSWISGMVLQQTPLPVFPMPSSFLAKDTGFEIGLPAVQSSPTVITGQHTPGIMATIQDATRFTLSRFDKVSATLTYTSPSATLGNLTLAQGSPYVYYRAANTTAIRIDGLTTVAAGASSSYLRYSKGGKDYGVVAGDGAKIAVDGSTATLSAPKGSLLTFYALPNLSADTLREFATAEVTSVAVTNSTRDTKTQTTFDYTTNNNRPTVFVPMSYSSVVNNDVAITTYDSIYGPMKAVKGTQFTTTVPVTRPANSLDISHVSKEHRQQLIKSLAADVATTTITAKDSYFAGKQLVRAATLLDIAQQLGQTDASNRLKTILRTAFDERLRSNYFYYDTTLKGVAAETKAFGSEDFNDHHFHYGYFIYAASILGTYDADFLQNSKKQINLLVADIASYESTADFPVRRNYDPYSAHSWAAGLSPFADGNNQESSSEAINAWNGVAMWADLTGNTQLKESAVWMLSNEAATAKAAWRTVDTSPSYLKDYTSPLTSLSFGGKRTYATFFSDAANTKLAIQLLPLTPTTRSFSADGASINSVVAASIQNDNFNVALGDYILMYLALHDPQRALQLAPNQHDNFIDDGNSRTYMNAWIYSLSDT